MQYVIDTTPFKILIKITSHISPLLKTEMDLDTRRMLHFQYLIAITITENPRVPLKRTDVGCA